MSVLTPAAQQFLVCLSRVLSTECCRAQRAMVITQGLLSVTDLNYILQDFCGSACML